MSTEVRGKCDRFRGAIPDAQWLHSAAAENDFRLRGLSGGGNHETLVVRPGDALLRSQPSGMFELEPLTLVSLSKSQRKAIARR